jgi:hypothetical protein
VTWLQLGPAMGMPVQFEGEKTEEESSQYLRRPATPSKFPHKGEVMQN